MQQALFALPFDHNVRTPIRLPGYLHLDSSQHVMLNVSRFRLRAHTLNVETASWEDGTSPTLPGDSSHAQPFLRQQLSVQSVFGFLWQHNNKLFFFVSELLDLLLAGADQPYAGQPNNLHSYFEVLLKNLYPQCGDAEITMYYSWELVMLVGGLSFQNLRLVTI
eukprot:1141000-Pelagomonas_calceolata.AAC.5